MKIYRLRCATNLEKKKNTFRSVYPHTWQSYGMLRTNGNFSGYEHNSFLFLESYFISKQSAKFQWYSNNLKVEFG